MRFYIAWWTQSRAKLDSNLTHHKEPAPGISRQCGEFQQNKNKSTQPSTGSAWCRKKQRQSASSLKTKVSKWPTQWQQWHAHPTHSTITQSIQQWVMQTYSSAAWRAHSCPQIRKTAHNQECLQVAMRIAWDHNQASQHNTQQSVTVGLNLESQVTS